MIWVAGIVFLMAMLRPSRSVLEVPARLLMNPTIHRQLFRVVWRAAPIVLATGYALLFGAYGGYTALSWKVTLSHIPGLLMSAGFLAIYLGPFRSVSAAFAAGDLKAGAAAMSRLRQLALLNLFLGILTIVLATFGG